MKKRKKNKNKRGKNKKKNKKENKTMHQQPAIGNAAHVMHLHATLKICRRYLKSPFFKEAAASSSVGNHPSK
jgi:hypothetical protein